VSLPRTLTQRDEGLGDWAVLTGYRGSIAHGMYVPRDEPNSIDDKDLISVCVPPKEFYLGLREYGSRGTKEIKQDEWDVVVYEARKFLSLLAKGNPNVLSLLWTEGNYMQTITPAGQLLLSNRHVFVGKHVYHSFVGYAHGQLHRMTHTQPTDQAYQGAKRRALCEKFGYDTKNAAHLVRILRMGIEFLTEGEMHVLRPDNNELLDIKRGEWRLERVEAEAVRLFKLAEEAYVRSSLPNNVDRDRVSEVCVQVVEEAWRNRR
jgi:predicted nucleotidyltransferase